MCVIRYYGPTRAGVNTARGGEGRDLDALTDRLRSLPIDIVYNYISPQLTPNFQIDPRIKKPQKLNLKRDQKFLASTRYIRILQDMIYKIIKIPFLFVVGFITIILGGIFGMVNIFIRK